LGSDCAQSGGRVEKGGQQVDALAVTAALLHDAVKNEDFEKALKLRHYRSILTDLQNAVAAEDFDKCLELKKQKQAAENELPELEPKKQAMIAALADKGETPRSTHATPTPTTPTTSAKLSAIKSAMWSKPEVAGGDSLSDESDESVVKGGAKAKKPTTSSTPTAQDEIEARWAQIAHKAAAESKKAGNKSTLATLGDAPAATKKGMRTSWDGGFSLAAAQAHQDSDSDASEKDEGSKQTLDESEASVAMMKKDAADTRDAAGAKKKKKQVKKKEVSAAEAKKKKKKISMHSTWATDVGGASLLEMANKKAKSKSLTLMTDDGMIIQEDMLIKEVGATTFVAGK